MSYHRPLLCRCGDVIGRIVEYSRFEPEEIEPFNEQLVDEEGLCYCEVCWENIQKDKEEERLLRLEQDKADEEGS